jgi:hypothetical protein
MYPKAREEYSIEMARKNTRTFCHRTARSVADLDMMIQGYYRARGSLRRQHPSLSLHRQWQTFAQGALRGWLPASGRLLSPRRPPCRPRGLLAAGTAVRLVPGRGWGMARGVGAGGRGAREHGTGWMHAARGKGRVNFLYSCGRIGRGLLRS